MRSLMILVVLLAACLSLLQCSTDTTRPRSAAEDAHGGAVVNGDDAKLGAFGGFNPQGTIPEVQALPYAGPFVAGNLVFLEYKPRILAGHPELDLEGFDNVALRISPGLWIEASAVPLIPRVRKVSLAGLAYEAHLTFARVCCGDDEVRDNAVAEALRHWLDAYQNPDVNCFINHNPDDPNDPYADRWYGAELVWAAWYNQGIDLANVGPPPYGQVCITPQQLADDDDVELGIAGGVVSQPSQQASVPLN